MPRFVGWEKTNEQLVLSCKYQTLLWNHAVVIVQGDFYQCD